MQTAPLLTHPLASLTASVAGRATRRAALEFATFLSLAMALFTGAGIASGEPGNVRFPPATSGPQTFITAGRASLLYCRQVPVDDSDIPDKRWKVWARATARLHTERRFLGFLYLRGWIPMYGLGAGGPGIKWIDDRFAVGVPSALALPAFLALPAWRCRRALTRRRRLLRERLGLCPTCGYDVRATPATCPECGAAPFATSYSAAQPP